MKEWKVRQEVYHRLTQEHSDDLNQCSIEIVHDVVASAVRYFHEHDIGWLYPSKSYVVAILYAKWLNEEFGEDIDKYNLITRKEPIKADKILLAYEEFDEEVPVSHVTDFLTHQPTIEPMFVSGVGHARVMKDPKVIERVMEFLQ